VIWLKQSNSPRRRERKRTRGEKPQKVSYKSRDRKWIKQRHLSRSFCFFLSIQKNLTKTSQVADAVKRYSYLLGQTELFKHFVNIKVFFFFFFILSSRISHLKWVHFSELAIQNTLLSWMPNPSPKVEVGKSPRVSSIYPLATPR